MRKWLLLFLFLVPFLAEAQTSTITWGTTFQTMDGFGGQDLNYPSMTSAQTGLFFTTTSGIGMEYLRVANVYTCPITGQTAAACLSDQTTITNAVAQGALLELGLGSPPCTLKNSGNELGESCTPSGSCAGSGAGCTAFQNGTPQTSGAMNGTCFTNNNSLATNYTDFANYIVNYVNTLAAFAGTRVSVVDVQNEPDIEFSFFAACEMSAAAYDTFVGTYLGPAFAAASWNSSQKTSPTIMLPSQAFLYPSHDYASTCLDDTTSGPAGKGCAGYVGIISGHSTIPAVSNFLNPSAIIAFQAAGGHLWASELDATSSTYNSGMTGTEGGLQLAVLIHDYLTAQNVSGIEWWELAYSPSFVPPNSGLVDGDNFSTTSRYYAEGNWSKFIGPGWIRMGASNPSGTSVLVSAFRSGTNFAIVAVNNSTSGATVTFTISGAPSLPSTVIPTLTDSTTNLVAQTAVNVSSGSFQYTLPASSVVTFTNGSGGGGGTGCPTDPQYMGPTVWSGVAGSGVPGVTIGSLGILNCYYISPTGSDSAAGTSTSTAWAHAPGMPTYTGSHTVAAGDAFIFEGGQTWGAANFPINTSWTVGTATNPIYFTVDTDWPSSGWTRPIWSCGGTTCGGAVGMIVVNVKDNYINFDGMEVTGMSYVSGNGSVTGPNIAQVYANHFMIERFRWHGATYTTPWTAPTLPQATLYNSSGGEASGYAGNTVRYNIVDMSDSNGGVGISFANGNNASDMPIAYGNYFNYAEQGFDGCGDIWHDNVVNHMGIPIDAYYTNNSWSGTATVTNGSTTVTVTSGTVGTNSGPINIGGVGYTIASSNLSNSITLTTAYTGASASGVAVSTTASFHQNAFKHLGVCYASGAVEYNDVVINQINWSGAGGAVKFWEHGSPGTYNDYVFNLIGSNNPNGNNMNIGDTSHCNSTLGTVNLFNLSIQTGVDGSLGVIGIGGGEPKTGDTTCPCGTVAAGSCTIGPGTMALQNNHWVTAATNAFTGACGLNWTCNETDSFYQSGVISCYSSTSTYALQPNAATCPTVTNPTVSIVSLCSQAAALDPNAQTPCLNGTTYGVLVNSANMIQYPNLSLVSRGSGASPNQGAYEFNGSGSTSPNIIFTNTSPVNFGSVNVGFTSSIQTITVQNNGTASGILSTPYFTVTGGAGQEPADFSNALSGTCVNGFVLAVNATCTVQMTFTPTLNTTESATLNIFMTTGQSGSIALQGVGVGGVSALSPTSLTFGSTNVGTTNPTPQSFTLKNNGPGLLTISSITASGDFAQTNTCTLGSAMAVNASCSFQVTFTPTAAGSRTGSISITDNGQNSPEVESLLGTGVANVENINGTILNGAKILNGAQVQ